MPFLQRYAYAGSNPANLVDPSGMVPWKGISAAALATMSLGQLAEAAGACAVAYALEYVAGTPSPCADILAAIDSAIEAAFDEIWDRLEQASDAVRASNNGSH